MKFEDDINALEDAADILKWFRVSEGPIAKSGFTTDESIKIRAVLESLGYYVTLNPLNGYFQIEVRRK